MKIIIEVGNMGVAEQIGKTARLEGDMKISSDLPEVNESIMVAVLGDAYLPDGDGIPRAP